VLTLIKLKEIGPVPGTSRARAQYNRAKKAAYLAIGKKWFADLRPQHFTKRGAQMYGYKSRKGDPGNPDPYGFRKSYQGQKLKKYGHTRPLVKTGESARATSIASITGSSRHVRLSMPGGWIGATNHKHHIDTLDEFTRLSDSDREVLAETWAESFDRALAMEQATKTTTIK